MVRSKVEAKRAVTIPQVEMVPYSRLNPSTYNPRKITPRQMEALKANIRAHGFLKPIVVQAKSMTIVGGHQGYRAVREIAVENESEVPDLPCYVLDLDERAARRLNVALNKVSGEFDDALLSELLSEVNHLAPLVRDDVLFMGFSEDASIASLLGDPVRDLVGGGDGPLPTTKAPSLNLDFVDKSQRDAVKSAIGAKARDGEPSGATLSRMLGVRVPKKPAS